MTFETYSFLEGVAAEDPGPMARAMMVSDAADRAGEAADRREVAEREAARAERAEALALSNRQLGDPLGELSRARAYAAAAGEEVTELRSKLERAEAKLARAQGNITFFVERMQAASDSAARSAGADLLAPAKAAHRAYVQASRRAWSEAQGRAPRPRTAIRSGRPFGGGAAVRSEQCLHCIEQGVSDEESYLLHSDPEFAVPVTPPGQPVQAEQAEYRSGRDGRVPMIYR